MSSSAYEGKGGSEGGGGVEAAPEPPALPGTIHPSWPGCWPFPAHGRTDGRTACRRTPALASALGSALPLLERRSKMLHRNSSEGFSTCLWSARRRKTLTANGKEGTRRATAGRWAISES